MTDQASKPKPFSKYSHETQPQTFDDLLALDTRPVPDYVRHFGDYDVGPTQVPTRWYTDPELHKAEVEKIWKRKWQMACRVDHVREIGDTYVYNVAELSFVIVRASKDEIKGYWNSCLHRGVPLRPCAGRVDRLQCPFHGFTWGLDGKSLLIPHAEEFPQIDQATFSLPEVKVSVWQGFVFINPDLNAGPLEEYVGKLDSELSLVPFTNRQLSMHVTKVFPANWKAVQEAFMESFHVLTTHPQFAVNMGERCTSFGADGNVSRGILTIGQTNDYVRSTPDEQQIYRAMQEFWDDETDLGEFALPEGVTAREAIIKRSRDLMRPIIGPKADEVSDMEACELFYYTVFPNFFPFGVFGQPMMYRFLPYGSTPDKSLMEVWMLLPLPDGVEPDEPVKPIWLDEDQEFSTVEALGSFGAFISQDSSNLGSIMTGLRNNQLGFVTFARKYESKIRHFYALYEKALDLSAAEEVDRVKSGC